MSTNNIQGSLTVRRLRTGDNINLYLTPDKDLFQGVDTVSGAIAPDWGLAANQPTITPTVTSIRTSVIGLSDHSWKNGNSVITFGTTADSQGWVTSTNHDASYKLNKNTGALKIIKNLANVNNVGNDILTYSCVATVNGTKYSMSKDITVRIQSVGASSYTASVSSPTNLLTETVTSTTVTCRLWLGTAEQTTFLTRWFRSDERRVGKEC